MNPFSYVASVIESSTEGKLSASRVVGVAAGAGAIALAFLHPDKAGTVTALGGLATAALAVRDGGPLVP